MSGDITKITQAYTAAQENMGKLIESAVSQTVTKAQDVTPPSVTTDSRTLELMIQQTTHMKQIGPLPGQQLPLLCHYSWNMTQIQTQRPYETDTSLHVYANQQLPDQTFFDFNQSIVELFRHQTELTHSTQHLHQ